MARRAQNRDYVGVKFSEQMKRHRVKVYIPAYYLMIFEQASLMQTIQEAIIGLNVWHYHIEPEVDGDGAYLCMFNKDSFPEVDDYAPTPDATLWLSASEGWKIQWQKSKVGSILMPSGNLINV